MSEEEYYEIEVELDDETEEALRHAMEITGKSEDEIFHEALKCYHDYVMRKYGSEGAKGDI